MLLRSTALRLLAATKALGPLRILLVVLALAGVTLAGWLYHRWAFDVTEEIRFVNDIRRNYDFGREALDGAYLNMYEDQLRDNPPTSQKIDYPPLRLATFAAWVAWNRHVVHDPEIWRPDYDFHAFLMCHNQVLQWLGAIAAFLIVRFWLREVAKASLPLGQAPPPWTGFWRASLAFLALWFDPGSAIIAHGWPSPNAWAVPYYLWTIYFCLTNRWFIAGACMGVGAMLQGQQLTVVAVFILWPLLALKPASAARWVCGFCLFFLLSASPWLLSLRPNLLFPTRFINTAAAAWLVASLALLALVGLRRSSTRLHWALFIIPAIAAAVSITYPARTTPYYPLVAATACALILLFWLTSWRCKRYLLAFAAALGLFACMIFWGATDAWWQVGFVYGTERFPHMSFGNMSNLPALLQHRFAWQQITTTALLLDPKTLLNWTDHSVAVSIRDLLLWLMTFLLVLSSAAIAIQWRRRGKYLLVALVLPWVVFYVIAPQMSPRYPVFAGAAGAICLGASGGIWLLMLMFSLLCVDQTALCMYSVHGYGDHGWMTREVMRLMSRIHPGISWALLLALALMLYLCLRPPRKSTPALPAASLSRVPIAA